MNTEYQTEFSAKVEMSAEIADKDYLKRECFLKFVELLFDIPHARLSYKFISYEIKDDLFPVEVNEIYGFIYTPERINKASIEVPVYELLNIKIPKNK